MGLKKVCIKDKKTGNIMRVFGSTAEIAVASGTHEYSTKSALKRFLNQQMKLIKNGSVINKMDFSNKSKNKIWEDPHTGKTYAAIWYRDDLLPTGKLDGSGKEEVISKPVYTFRIAKFPS